MKYPLKPKDTKDIEGFKKFHPVGRALAEIQTWGFSVGDVLVRYKLDANGSRGDIDVVSEKCPIPKKFRIVFMDDLGIPWAKQILVKGGLGNKLYCLATHIPNYSWEMDPEKIYADLVGYTYDPRIEYKRMRDANPEYGGE